MWRGKDDAEERPEVQRQGGDHEDAEQNGIGPMGGALYAVKAKDSDPWMRGPDRGGHRDHELPGSVGPVEPSIHPLTGYPFCSQKPGST